MPNPALTPGAVATTDRNVICAPGYARAHRVWDDKAGTLRKYGIPPNDAGGYEDDDLIPVCLGGNNADPRNHWPQPRAEAYEKDDLEWYACRDVCVSGGSLAWWQSGFRIDWRPLYRKIFRRDP